jgi:histidinol-phosphatase (PHP family)
MALPPDNHVHSEWSWDARYGSMEQTCVRAQQIGLPSIAFTEHLDHTAWRIDPDRITGLSDDHPMVRFGDGTGQVTPPAFDADGYREALERCRARHPGLRILSGLEVGEPHWHSDAVEEVLEAGSFDRVLGSLHGLPAAGGFEEPAELFEDRAPDEVLRQYLAEVVRLVRTSDVFAILAHVDYPVRFWPTTRVPFDPTAFEEEFRCALRATAETGRILEVNTAVPLHPVILGWWRDEGGEAITFGSDAHDPSELARNFPAAVDIAEATGFRPSRDALDPWTRS